MISATTAQIQMEEIAAADRQPPPQTWPSYHFRAMGSDIGLWLDCGPQEAGHHFARVEALFARIEARLSRFRKQSELSRLNARPGQWIPVSGLLWSVLQQALNLARETAGLFDPTLLAALEAAGYTISFDEMAGRAGAGGGPAQPGRWQELRLDAGRQAVWLPAGVRLDFGGIGKGYTAAAAVRLLSEAGPALVDAGGDLVAGAPPAGLPGWPVAVAAPGGEEAADLFHLWLANAALATSGTDYRHWRRNGRLVHHLIDPRTGRPAESDLVAVTVLAPTAAAAEAWATATLIAGQEAGSAMLTARGLAGALTGGDGISTLTPALMPHVVWPAL